MRDQQEETEFRFEQKAKQNAGMSSFRTFLWNSRTREFLGRDGESWGRLGHLTRTLSL